MSLLYEPNLQCQEEELGKSIDYMMEAYFNNQHNSGLMRYRSAPSSYLESLVDGSSNSFGGITGDDVRRSRATSTWEMESLLTKCLSPGGGPSAAPGFLGEQGMGEKGMKLKRKDCCVSYRNDGYTNSSEMHRNFEAQDFSEDATPINNSSAVLNNNMKGSNLLRQSSTPAELLSHLMQQSAFSVMGDSRSLMYTNGKSGSSTCERKSPASSSFKPSSSSPRLMPQIPETDGQTENIPSFVENSWNEISFGAIKEAEGTSNLFSGLRTSGSQNMGFENRFDGLTHHLSLPKSYTEKAMKEKSVRFQGSVPYRLRAKRGCATNPRSIAERVRRTRITERMKKLQELFPDMDKQTSTADMLDMAVVQIKDLQRQLKTLADMRAECTCSSEERSFQVSWD